MVPIQKNSRGFTLLELMIVIAINGILAAIAIPNFLKYRDKAKIAQAVAELKEIQIVIMDFAIDTNLWPGGSLAGIHKPQGVGFEYEDLSTPDMGLTDTDGSYPDWHGPYYTGSFQDPWGNNYFFDEDYTLDGATVAAIGSYGPNGEGLNDYDDDDIVLVLPAE